MFRMQSRRTFLTQASSLLLASRYALGADAGGEAIAETTYGKVRGAVNGGIRAFKGIPYGADTSGKNRFMPPVKPAAWTGVRDALEFGPPAPQAAAGAIIGNEDCLVLNVFTPSLEASAKKPVMVWLHGGGFSFGTGSDARLEGSNLARLGDVVVVTINHRLNVFGYTYLGEQFGPDFAASGSLGMLDIVAALQWVRDNIAHFGGDPNVVTIFGQSGGGRKVATLMSMPAAQGLYHRAIIESGAILKLTTREAAIQYTDYLLADLGLKGADIRQLQSVPMLRLMAANEAALKKTDQSAPGYTANSPVVDGRTIPSNPWDPKGPAISARIPLVVGWAHTEETLYDRPTPEKLTLDEAGLKERAQKRLGVDPTAVIAAYRKDNPDASPWDLYILIATDHPRGTYARELAKRKVLQGAAPAYVYRFDFETPEGGGHMRSPHAVEVPFVFDNLATAGKLISKMPDAQALAEKLGKSWTAFARTGDPNTAGLPKWPAYSVPRRETMLFSAKSKVATDPNRVSREAMEKVLGLA